jgi:peptidoglycan/LPS O-acetylase OafA/YrhL
LDFGLTQGGGLLCLGLIWLVLTMILALIFERLVDRPLMSVIQRIRRHTQTNLHRIR